MRLRPLSNGCDVTYPGLKKVLCTGLDLYIDANILYNLFILTKDEVRISPHGSC